MTKIAVVVLAAGKGTRMKSRVPKALHPLAGRPMIAQLLASVAELGPDRVVLVTGPDMEAVAEAANGAGIPVDCVVQRKPLGTGDAVSTARETLDGFAGDILVLYGDVPLIRPETMRALIEARARTPQPAIVVLGMRLDDPRGYGRLIVDEGGALDAIVEHRDASAEQRAIDLCNSGVMAVAGAHLFGLLDDVGNDNAKGEIYLTDIVAVARGRGLACGFIETDADEVIGINSRADLARVEALVQERLRRRAMEDGATMIDPASVHLSFDTVIGRDVTVEPQVVFGPGVRVGDGVRIRAFSHLEGATVEQDAVVGPNARLRPGAKIGPGAQIGNFVEIKAATIEAGAKVNHLTYIGDARVGERANVGAGTITCNYDGFTKSHTDIGAGAFIGSNTALVAPVSIGDGAVIGAGSVITLDVKADALALTRAEQKSLEGGAARLRAKKRAAKLAKGGTKRTAKGG